MRNKRILCMVLAWALLGSPVMLAASPRRPSPEQASSPSKARSVADLLREFLHWIGQPVDVEEPEPGRDIGPVPMEDPEPPPCPEGTEPCRIHQPIGG